MSNSNLSSNNVLNQYNTRIIVAVIYALAIIICAFAYMKAQRYELYDSLIIDKYNNTIIRPEFKKAGLDENE